MQAQSNLRCFCMFICCCFALLSFFTENILDCWSCMAAIVEHNCIWFRLLNPEPEPSRALQTIPLQCVGRVQAQTASRVWMSDRMLLHEKQSNTAIPQASQALDTTLDHFWRSVCCWVNPLILGLEIWHVIDHDISVSKAFSTHHNHHTLRPW